MISLIIPTRNRASVLARTAHSYFKQQPVDEIIVVDDAGSDDTSGVLASIASQYADKSLMIIHNAERVGASQSRNIGVSYAKNELVMFCDDDEFLEADHAAVCLKKMREYDAAIVSGRRVYMKPGETPEQAIARFGNGLRNARPMRRAICEFVNGARFDGDLEVPLTNAVILTRKELLLSHPFDAYYARGNGYREESDYQMNLYTRGHRIIVTNDCHSMHLPFEDVPSGGQRISKLARVCWSIHYTNYFFKKYYRAYAERQQLRTPRWAAMTLFSAFSIYSAYVRPVVYPAATALLGGRPRASSGVDKLKHAANLRE